MTIADRVWIWFAWRLPKSLVYWCVIRVAMHEPDGLSQDDFTRWEIVPDRRFADGLRFWKSL